MYALAEHGDPWFENPGARGLKRLGPSVAIMNMYGMTFYHVCSQMTLGELIHMRTPRFCVHRLHRDFCAGNLRINDI